jgi:three-Cys-motif partner protein
MADDEKQRRAEQLILIDLPAASSDAEPEVRPLRHPIWTENKARLIERYLYYFVLVTKHGTYIDGFAGPQRDDQEGMWAAQLVIQSKPPWLRHFYLFDADADQVQRLKTLKHFERTRATQAGDSERDIQITHGDFNQEVARLLAAGRIGQKEATFCLLDQRTFECSWATVEALATYKQAPHKLELFYFLPYAWLDRALSAQRDLAVIERWWGRSDWDRLRAMRPRERVDVIVERFKEELGYRSTKAWPIYERCDGGPVMYYMIHATDHMAAPELMRRAYEAAVSDPPTEQLGLDFGTDATASLQTVIVSVSSRSALPSPD